MPKIMKKSVELSVRASEIKSEINALDPGDGSLEKRRELHGNLNTVEAEWRTAVTEEAEADAGAPDAQGLTAGEEREFRQLETKAELRQVFRAAMNGDPLTGPEKELQEHRGLSGHNDPLGSWLARAPRPARKIALTRYPAHPPIRTCSNIRSWPACSPARRPQPWAWQCRWLVLASRTIRLSRRTTPP